MSEFASEAAPPKTLPVLHVLRVTGLADDDVVAERGGVDQDTVRELLLDYQAYGWVTRVEFAGTTGWTLTERGRAEDYRRLTEELISTGAKGAVEQAHRAFGPLNARVVRACTDWQLRPQGGDQLAVNDHRDPTWDGRVLDELAAVDGELAVLVGELADSLPRFGDYPERFSAALARARAGQVHWVAGVGLLSCHTVWMQLHEDLLSTLGISRHAESDRQD
jgi:hypothetical protein